MGLRKWWREIKRGEATAHVFSALPMLRLAGVSLDDLPNCFSGLEREIVTEMIGAVRQSNR